MARKLFSPRGWDVDLVNLEDVSAQEQVLCAATSAIYISVVGGGASIATFLPRGAVLILMAPRSGGRRATDVVPGNFTAFLDWDFFTHASHIHTVWESISPSDSVSDRVLQQIEWAILHTESFVAFDRPGAVNDAARSGELPVISVRAWTARAQEKDTREQAVRKDERERLLDIETKRLRRLGRQSAAKANAGVLAKAKAKVNMLNNQLG